MNDHIEHQGVRLIPSRAAARLFRISHDYIGRLCKQEKVAGKLISGSWFVSEESLRDFLLTVNKSKYERREMMREARAAEYREAQERISNDVLSNSESVSKETAPASLSISEPINLPAPTGRFSSYMRTASVGMLALIFIVTTYRMSDASMLGAVRQWLPAAAQFSSINTGTAKGVVANALGFKSDNASYWMWYDTNVQSQTATPAAVAETPSIIERIVDRVVPGGFQGITEQLLDARLGALEQRIVALISLVPPGNSVPNVYHYVNNAASSFNNIAITDSSYIGGTITDATITGGSVTATAFDGVVPVANGGTGTSTYATGDILYATSTDALGRLPVGSNGQVLKVVGGNLAWSIDLSGGGGGSGAFATTSDDLAIYVADPSDVVIIGDIATSTTGNILEVVGNSLVRGALTAYNTITAPIFTATSTTATSTLPMLNITGSLGLGSDYLTDITGSGLSIQSGALTLDTSGNWTGTFDGQEGSYYLANSFSTTSADYYVSQANLTGFSTTSADYWKTQRDFFSTTSAQYFASVTDLFSTTSASYFLSQNQGNAFSTTSAINFVNSSTTIPKTYTANTFNALQTFANASSTYFSSTYASSTNLLAGAFTLGTLNGPLQANAGVVSATTSIGVRYGGTGLTSAPTYGQMLIGQADGTYQLVATSSLGITGGSSSFSYPFPNNATTTLLAFNGGLTATNATTTTLGLTGVTSALLATRADGTVYATTTLSSNLLDTSGNWTGTFDGLEGSAYLANSFSTTSADYWETQQTARTADDLSNNSIEDLSDVAAITENYGDLLFWNGTSWADIATSSLGLPTSATLASYLTLSDWYATTTDGLDEGITNRYFTEQRATDNFIANLAATTSVASIISLPNLSILSSQVSNFNDTVNSFIHSSTTIPKTYTSNTFTALQTFNAGLTTNAFTLGSLNGPLQANNGVVSATTSIGVLYGGTGLTSAPTYGQLLVGNALGGYTLTSTSSLGISAGGGSSLFTDGGATTYLTASDNLGLGTTTANSKLTVYGDFFLEGADRYANFGTTTGSSGYGFRDNAGVMEFKNANGTWQGVTTATTGPSFRVTKNATQAVTAGVNEAVTFGVEEFDTNNNFASNRFTPTVPGKYFIEGQVKLDASTNDGGRLTVMISKNGTPVAANADIVGGTGAVPTVAVSTLVNLNGTTDYVELVANVLTDETIDDACNTFTGGAGGCTHFAGAMIAPVSATAGGWTNDNTQSYLIDTTDKVGIGTTTPWAKLAIQATGAQTNPLFEIASSSSATKFLSVAGDGFGTTTVSGLNISGLATTTSNVGMNITSGCYAVGGVCLSVGGAGSAYPFFGANNSTSTLTQFNGGLTAFASSTIGNGAQAGGLTINGGATTTGNAYFGANVGVGTTTPWGLLSVHANVENTNRQLFVVASSSAASVTTLFSVSHLGTLDINPLTTATTSIITLNGVPFLSGINTSLFLGRSAGANNGSAGSNTGIGVNTLNANTAGSSNTAVGYNALVVNTASQNTAVGRGALTTNTTGQNNAAFGYQALDRNKTGSLNTGLGINASFFNGSATNTVAVGAQAAQGASAFFAQGYTIVGYQAGFGLTSGSDYNTLLGYRSGSAVTSGYGNILIGASTNDNNLTSGDGNIGIGYNTFFPDATGNNQLNIGGLIFGTLPATSTSLVTNPTGVLGIGTTTPGSLLSVGDTNGINFSTATSTFSSTGGIDLRNGGCFAIGGNCLTQGITSTAGDWTGTFDGQEGSYYLANSFSTTSATYFTHSSTTIPKTYTSNVFTGANTFNDAFTLGSLNGPLQANNGVVSATTSIGVLYGGTGLTSAPAYGNILVGNSSGGYTLTATSSLGLSTFAYLFPNNATTSLLAFNGGLTTTNATATNIFAGSILGNTARFGMSATTSIDSAGNTIVGGTLNVTGNTMLANATSTSFFTGNFKSNNLAIGQTATATISNAGVLTLPVALVAGSGGTGISNPSAAGILLGSYAGGSWQQLATSSLGIGINDTTGTLGVSRGGTGATSFTSGSLLYGAGTGALQSVATTTATIGGSLSYSGTFGALVGGAAGTLSLNTANANTWSALQTFANASSTFFSSQYASTTNLFATTASTSNLTISNVANTLLKTNASGQVVAAIAGTDYASASSVFGKSWEMINSATLAPTTTLGILVSASSTIGNGTQAGGLTIAGGATTTGSAFISDRLSIGSLLPAVIGGSSALYASTSNSAGVAILNGNTTPSLGIALNDTVRLFLGIASGNNTLINGTLTNDVALRTNNTNFLLSTDAGLTSAFTVRTTGNVGIGTTTPHGLLEVNSGGLRSTFDTNADDFIINASGSGGITINTGNTNVGGLLFADTDNNKRGFIEYDHSVNDFAFGTNGTEHLTLTSAGNFGIGTTTPAYSLDVYNTDGARLGRFRDTDSTYEGLVLSSDTGGGYVGNSRISSTIGESIYFQNSTNAMRFYTNATERARLTSTGNFGIGTTSPGSALSIQGNVFLAGNIISTSTATSTFAGGLQTTALNVTSSTASSTFANGIQLSTGCFRGSDGLCITNPNLSAYVDGSGATNRLAYWSDSNTLTSNATLTFDGTTLSTGELVVTDPTPFFAIDDDDSAGYDFTIDVADGSATLHSDVSNSFIGSFLGFGVDGSELMRIESDGNVGIGNGATLARLSVTNSGSVPSFLVEDTASTDSTPFIIDATGNVGVGITAPRGPLDVTKDGYDVLGTGDWMEVGRFVDASELKGISLGYDSNDDVSVIASHTGGGGENGIAFWTYGGAWGERMRLSNNGLLGIGTTSPGSLLSVGDTNGINFTLATSTFGGTGGINLVNGCFAINGTCLSTGNGSAFSYLFPNNATTSLLAFNGGITAYASSTIGDGTAGGGLTVHGGANMKGLVSIYTTGANPSIYNPTAGNGLILRGDTNEAQLRIVSNPGAWTGGATSTTYFQITNAQNNNVSFMGGTYGNDVSMNRLQFNASSTQFTDLHYDDTPIPESVLEAISSTANKIGLKVRGATAQTAEHFSVQNVSGSRLLNVASTGNIGIGTTTPLGLLSLNPNGITGPAFVIGSSTGTLLSVSNAGLLTMGTLSNVTLDPTSGTGSLFINYGSTELSFDDSQFYILGAGEMNFDSTTGDFELSGTQNTLTFGGDDTSGYAFEINNFLRVAADGNGTTTFSGLDINGSATSTSNVGFNLSDGCYAINGTCISGSGSSGANDFTFATNFNTTNAATSSILWAQSGINASSTSRFAETSFFGRLNFATSTANVLATFQGGSFITASSTAFNTSVGEGTLGGITSGSQNTALGYNVLSSASSASGNVGVGYRALSSVSFSGSQNTGVGGLALANLSSGSGNAGLGYRALTANTTGSQNTGIGNESLRSNTTGTGNVGLGYFSSYWNQSATSTVSIGYSAGIGSGSFFAQGYTITGYQAGSVISTGSDYNTFYGYQSGSGVTSGYGNILLGPSVTANNLTTGDGNIGIGYNTFFPSATGNNQLNIGGLVFGSLPATSTALTLPTSGSFGIGSTSPFAKFVIQTNNGDTASTLFAIGSSTASATTTLFSISNTGSTTAANGFNITSGCYAIGGTCLSTGGSSGANDFTFSSNFNATNAATSSILWAQSGLNASSTVRFGNAGQNAFLWNSSTGRLGLGVLSPTEALDVAGSININQYSSYKQAGETILYSSTTRTTTYVGIGAGGLLSNTSAATGNTALGYNALALNSSGNTNTALGAGAMSDNTSGDNNIAIGSSALATHQNAQYTIAIGSSAAGNAAGAIQFGTIIGYTAGANLTTGSNNTLLGAMVGDSLTSGGNNIAIGYDIELPSNTGSNQLNIGNLLFGTGIDGTGTTLSSGNIGIGTTTPYARLSVVGEVAARNFTATSTTATSTFAGGFDVGGGALKYDFSAGLTSVQNLALGALTFDTDGGILSWIDMPVTSSATAGTVESYSAQIDGTSILTVYSESDGLGGIKATSTRIGIGTTTPFATLAIQAAGAQTHPLLEIASSSIATKFLSVSGTGFGTTTLSGLTISGSATSTSNVGLRITSSSQGISLAGLTSCTQALETDANGNIICGTDQTSGGGITGSTGQIPYFSATDTLSATSTLFITSNGNIGVGTTTPAIDANNSRILNVSGYGTANGNGVVGIGGAFTGTADTVGQLSFYNSALSVADKRIAIISGTTDGATNSGTLRFTTFDAGTASEKMRLSAAGNLGIGTTTPWGALSVTNIGSGPSFIVEDQASPDSSPFVVSATGSVGVGTSSPVYKLDVFGNSTGIRSYIDSDSSNTAVVVQGDTGALLRMITYGSAAPGSMLGNTRAGDVFLPADGADLTIGTVDANFVAFSSNSIERMRILSGGNVGIGTTTPQWLLNPFSATAPQLSLSAGAGIAQWAFRNAGGNLYLSTTTVAGTATTTLPAFTINNTTSNVGIGVAAPAYRLDVAGDINVQSGGCFRVNGVCIGYVVKLHAIYSTSTPGTNVATVFTGASGAAPSFSGGTLTLPSNTVSLVVETRGGGGGGGGVSSAAAIKVAAGGGEGGYARDFISAPTGTYRYTVGIAGTAGTNAGGTGGTGGATCFGTNATACTTPLAAANGGTGGTGGTSAAIRAGGVAGAGTAGDVILTGEPGGATVGATANNIQSGKGGGAGGGRAVVATAAGVSGVNGGGGSGAAAITAVATANAGGAGGAGVLIVTVYATSSPNAAGNDLAEMFPMSDPSASPGDIVAVDTGMPVSLKLAKEGESEPLAGVIATQPGIIMGDQNAEGMKPVALSGRVPVRASLEGGMIKPGDRIAPSSKAGIGKKASPFEDSVGIALDTFDGTEGETTVMMFVTLGRGIDINAIALGLLGEEVFGAIAATSTASTTATMPLDFVGGVMQAIATRVDKLTLNEIHATSTETATSTAPIDTFAESLMRSIFSRITQWFADAANGIGDFFANRLKTKELCVQGDSGEETCITKTQLDALLAGAGVAASGGDEPEPENEGGETGTTTPPTTDSGSGGGSNDGNASSTPPVTPPAEEPEAETSPAEDPIAETPPAETPPAEEPAPEPEPTPSAEAPEETPQG